MEVDLEKVFKRVHELTGKYPNLNEEELNELGSLSKMLSVYCKYELSDRE